MGMRAIRILIFVLASSSLFSSSVAAQTELKPVKLFYQGQPYISYSEKDHKRLLMRLQKGRTALGQLVIYRKKVQLQKDTKALFGKLDKVLHAVGLNVEQLKKHQVDQVKVMDQIITEKDRIIKLKDKRFVELRKRLKPIHHEPLFWVGVGCAVLGGVGVGVVVGLAVR